MFKNIYTKINKFWSNHQFLVWTLTVILWYIWIDKFLVKIINWFWNLLSIFWKIRDYILYKDFIFQHIDKINESYMWSILIFMVWMVMLTIFLLDTKLIKDKKENSIFLKDVALFLIVIIWIYAWIWEIQSFKYQNKEDLLMKIKIIDPFLNLDDKKNINIQLYNIDWKENFDLLSTKLDELIKENSK